MTEHERLTILNHAFVRIYRSFGQYLRLSYPSFDLSEKDILALVDRQAEDAQRLGKRIAERCGNVFTDTFPMEYNDMHYLNASRVLREWLPIQKSMVASLKDDLHRLGNDVDAPLLREIVQHEDECLRQLEKLNSTAPAAA